MMVNLKCHGCSHDFGVESQYAFPAKDSALAVAILPFCCPYCQRPYRPNTIAALIGLSGAVSVPEIENVSRSSV